MIPTAWLYRILGGALAVAALLWLVHSRDHWRDEARSNAQLFRQEKAAHAATVAKYRAAAEQARREDAANLARVKAEQAAINERTRDDFETRIASARAAAAKLSSGRLRQQASAAAADPRDRGAAPVPGLPASAGGAAESAGEGGLSSSDRLIATEQAIQLDELIRWIRAQAGVDNGNASSSSSGK